MIKLYGVPGWGSAISEVMLTLADIPYQFVNVDGFDQPGPQRELLLKLNPLCGADAGAGKWGDRDGNRGDRPDGARQTTRPRAARWAGRAPAVSAPAHLVCGERLSHLYVCRLPGTLGA